MTRRKPAVQPCGERHERYRHCLPCNPPRAEDPTRVRGPELGAHVTYANPRYPALAGRATVTERSYVWAPGDPAYHGGSRRYDWKVIRLESGQTLCVDDAQLTVIPS